MSARGTALRIRCATCGSAPGAVCRSPNGRYRKAVHRVRLHDSGAARFSRFIAPKPFVPGSYRKPVSPARAAAVAFFESDQWRTLRYQALKLHGAMCQCCGAGPAPSKPLHVDHIKPRSRFPDLALVLSNLQVLCVDCNKGKGAWDETDWRGA